MALDLKGVNVEKLRAALLDTLKEGVADMERTCERLIAEVRAAAQATQGLPAAPDDLLKHAVGVLSWDVEVPGERSTWRRIQEGQTALRGATVQFASYTFETRVADGCESAFTAGRFRIVVAVLPLENAR